MSIDLTGGIDPSREYMFTQRPEDPEMRDSVSFWTLDDRGQIGLPRIGVEAVAANWDNHEAQINIAFPDGRVYRLRADGPSLPPESLDGESPVLGGGRLGLPLCRAVRNLDHELRGKAVQTSSADLVAGKTDGPLVDVAFHVEAEMAVPPWIQGALQRDAGDTIKNSVEGALMGGPRYEQLFRATGTVTIAGDTQDFREAACGSGGKVCESLLASGATPGSPRCFPAERHSATSPIRRDPTASRRSTRATSSPATAI